jgi:hypothetical protein
LVKILSGTFEGKTTGMPIALIIQNTDHRSKDYGNIANSFRPGHADYTYQQAQSNSCVIWIVFKFCHNRCPARLTKKATFIVVFFKFGQITFPL